MLSVWSEAHSLVTLEVIGRLWRVHQLWHFLYPVSTLFLCCILIVSVVASRVLDWLLQWFSSICSSVVHDQIVLLWWIHMCSDLVSWVQRLHLAALCLYWSIVVQSPFEFVMHRWQVVHLVIRLHWVPFFDAALWIMWFLSWLKKTKTGRLLMIDFIFLNVVCCCESHVYITSCLHSLLSGSVRSDSVRSNLLK